MFHVTVAFVIDVIKYTALDDEIGGEIINIQSGGVDSRGHFLDLTKIGFFHGIVFDQLIDGGAVDVFFQNPFVGNVDVQHSGDSDSCLQKSLIIIAFRFDFVSEGVVVAGFMVDLLQDIIGSVPLRQIGIAAFSMAQQLYNVVFGLINKHDILHGMPFVIRKLP